MKEIPLTKGFVAFVDNADFDWLFQWKWYASLENGKIYAARNSPRPKRAIIKMHRQILGLTIGVLESDHIDGNGLNNCRSNLRVVTHNQNLRNQRLSKANTSGFVGVTRHSQNPSWCAQIKVDGKRIYLGSFATPEQAARIRDDAARRYFGQFARLNFPP